MRRLRSDLLEAASSDCEVYPEGTANPPRGDSNAGNFEWNHPCGKVSLHLDNRLVCSSLAMASRPAFPFGRKFSQVGLKLTSVVGCVCWFAGAVSRCVRRHQRERAPEDPDGGEVHRSILLRLHEAYCQDQGNCIRQLAQFPQPFHVSICMLSCFKLSPIRIGKLRACCAVSCQSVLWNDDRRGF